MAIETLGQAMDASWRLRTRCSLGKQVGMKRIAECRYGGDLDLPSLVWTRGRDFPLSRLESRLKCPRCGARQVTVLFDVPTVPRTASG